MDERRLESIPLFASLSRKERAKVAQHADEVDLREGKHLVDEGDFSYEVFVIEDGTAEVLHGDEPLAELGPGDFFGETGVLERAQRSASVVTTSPMSAIVITGHEFRQLAREMPGIASAMKQECERRARDVVAQAGA
jgi:CRP-like cAMP-binding protein